MSKPSLIIWKFSVHVLLKPSLENFEHYFTSVWDKCNCAVVWAFFVIACFGIGMKTDHFQSCGHCWVFQICWHIDIDLLISNVTLAYTKFPSIMEFIYSCTWILLCSPLDFRTKFFPLSEGVLPLEYRAMFHSLCSYSTSLVSFNRARQDSAPCTALGAQDATTAAWTQPLNPSGCTNSASGQQFLTWIICAEYIFKNQCVFLKVQCYSSDL